jgi:hypothetical protein
MEDIAVSIKEEFAQIAEDKDVTKFRDFLKKYASVVKIAVADQINAMSDDDVKRFLTWWTATRPEFAEHWEHNRNILRIEMLEEDLKKKVVTLDLKKYIKKHNRFPICNDCMYFDKAPPGPPGVLERPCMHLGATPTDYACAGWTKKEKRNDVQGSN